MRLGQVKVTLGAALFYLSLAPRAAKGQTNFGTVYTGDVRPCLLLSYLFEHLFALFHQLRNGFREGCCGKSSRVPLN